MTEEPCLQEDENNIGPDGLYDESRTTDYIGPGERLDKVLTGLWPDLSRARWQALVKGGYITVAGQKATSVNFKVQSGTQINARIPPPAPATPKPEDIPLDVVYEDEDLIVINKPAGMVVHPAAGNTNGTLVNALLHHCQGSLSGIGGELRPGIVHRLDKDTSGIMVAAKNDHAHQSLSSQFAAHSVHRIYTALVWGQPSPPEGRIIGNIGRHPTQRQKMAVVENGGKHAVTHYKTHHTFIYQKSIPVSLITCKLETGRTHQIRVHMTKIDHPLLGDPIYTSRKYKNFKLEIINGHSVAIFNRQALHAGELGFTHPRTGKFVNFNQEIPNDIKSLRDTLEIG